MGLIEIICIAVGLAMDAVAISMTNGMCLKDLRKKDAAIIAAFFGVFQGIMPLLGFFAGSAFSDKFRSIDHWIAFILLGLIGAKMIYGALKNKGSSISIWSLSCRLLLAQSIATSLDAFMVGMSFASFQVAIGYACSIIAGITFLLSLIAVWIGRRFGTVFSQKSELIGGTLLILIGLKILISHFF